MATPIKEEGLTGTVCLLEQIPDCFIHADLVVYTVVTKITQNYNYTMYIVLEILNIILLSLQLSFLFFIDLVFWFANLN
jgi:hypothetical protein